MISVEVLDEAVIDLGDLSGEVRVVVLSLRMGFLSCRETGSRFVGLILSAAGSQKTLPASFG